MKFETRDELEKEISRLKDIIKADWRQELLLSTMNELIEKKDKIDKEILARCSIDV